MRLFINGKRRHNSRSSTLAEILQHYQLKIHEIFLEINGVVVDTAQMLSRSFHADDHVHIVSRLAGGAGDGALVIVESPAKAKTITKFLGGAFVVKSSMGHVVDLPGNKMAVDIAHDFEPEYQVIPSRKKMVAELKKIAKEKPTIYLAQDPDREGEAISWHLSNLLGKKKKVYRVTFHEITERAIKEAFKHPAEIDLKKVDAQQARRILDRIVGYSLSPLLWRKVSRGLSAGRVQSVALRLIVERERKILAFVPKEYWEIEAQLKKRDQPHEEVTAKLEKIDDKKIDIENEAQSKSIMAELSAASFVVDKVEKKKRKKNPLPPFTTSTLQQDAFNKLRFPAEKTMRVAQSLYEGLEIGEEGSVGLITYMRTDSVQISTLAQQEAREYITQEYGKDYLPATPPKYKSRKRAQEAHEAIRPTSCARSPRLIESCLTPDQMKLYELIWRRFLASQMKPAEYEQKSITIKAGRCFFKATGSRLAFPGFIALYPDNDNDKTLPELSNGEELDVKQLIPSQHFTKPPGRFTDASLVKALEEEGIGRPSTYAPIIHTIVARDYVRRKGGSLMPTELGMIVADLLVEHFPKTIDVTFTSRMENEFDKIEEGKLQRVDVLKKFYGTFEKTLKKANEKMKSIKHQQIATGEVCDLCGEAMVIKWGRKGKFMSCSAFPKCKGSKPISTGVPCPEESCEGQLVERRSRAGRIFYGCTLYPKCKYTANRLPANKDEETKKENPENKETTGEN